MLCGIVNEFPCIKQKKQRLLHAKLSKNSDEA